MNCVSYHLTFQNTDFPHTRGLEKGNYSCKINTFSRQSPKWAISIVVRKQSFLVIPIVIRLLAFFGHLICEVVVNIIWSSLMLLSNVWSSKIACKCLQYSHFLVMNILPIGIKYENKVLKMSCQSIDFIVNSVTKEN